MDHLTLFTLQPFFRIECSRDKSSLPQQLNNSIDPFQCVRRYSWGWYRTLKCADQLKLQYLVHGISLYQVHERLSVKLLRQSTSSFQPYVFISCSTNVIGPIADLVTRSCRSYPSASFFFTRLVFRFMVVRRPKIFSPEEKLTRVFLK